METELILEQYHHLLATLKNCSSGLASLGSYKGLPDPAVPERAINGDPQQTGLRQESKVT